MVHRSNADNHDLGCRTSRQQDNWSARFERRCQSWQPKCVIDTSGLAEQNREKNVVILLPSAVVYTRQEHARFIKALEIRCDTEMALDSHVTIATTLFCGFSANS